METEATGETDEHGVPWHDRALNAEDLLCRLLVYARPAAEGYTIPRFLVSDAEELMPGWRDRRSRVLERREQVERTRESLAGRQEDDGADIFDGTATGFGTPEQRAAWLRAREDAERWVEKPLLERAEVEAVGDGEVHLVRLTRLWEPEPKVQYEGEALIRRDRDLLNVVAPGVDSWAEYSLAEDFSGGGLVAEDYMLEFLRP